MFPSLPQFLSWSRNDSIIPFVLEVPFPPGGDAFPQFQELSARLPFTFFFDSFNARPLGRYSYFPLSAPRKRWVAKSRPEFSRQWKKLRSEIGGSSPDFARIVHAASASPAGPLRRRGQPLELPPFLGGAVAFLSYDAGRAFERGWKSRPPADPLRFPWMEAGIYDDLYCLDHHDKRAYVISCLRVRSVRKAQLAEAYRYMESALSVAAERVAVAAVKDSSRAALLLATQRSAGSRPGKISVERADRKRFLHSVALLQDYIAAGDIYQANLSRRVTVPYRGAGLNYFARLRRINPSPYAFYGQFKFGELASCSPELLVKKRGPTLETRPIAGTRPRGGSVAADRKLQGELLLSAKERAEHVMLLDLERNDLSRVSAPGTVRVKESMVVEKYSHVMHIVSCVQSRIRSGRDAFDAIEAVFPGGTITGCPKVRCMNILDELEPVRRGPFYGSFGWIGYGGDCEMNLLIRTALLPKNAKSIVIQAGSGIVADSDAAREFEESGHKARALLAAAEK